MRPIRFARLLLALGGLLAATVRPATAQEGCTYPWQGEQTGYGCEIAPQVGVVPQSLTTSQPSVPFWATATDVDGGLVDSTFQVKINDTLQAGMWVKTLPRSGTNWINREFWQQGVAALSTTRPTSTVSARVCDVHSHTAPAQYGCPEMAVQYTLAVPGVEVGPHGTESFVVASPYRTTSFTVTNRGTTAATFVLTPECRDETGAALNPCSVSQPTVTLEPGAPGTVNLTFQANRVGARTFIKLTAAHQGTPAVFDTGWRDIIVYTAANGTPSPLGVQLVDLNSGSTIVRSQCVTIAVGPGAAYECGDLRLAHALPAVRWRGRARPAVLLFNSQHADPNPVLYANVTTPLTGARPDSVSVSVWVDGVQRALKTYGGADFHPGIPRRVAVTMNARAMATDVYPYQMQVTARWLASGISRTTTETGEFTVVNRYGSPFGAGWWLAGLEQIVVPAHAPSTRLWIGGDGSTRVYRPVPGVANRWIADVVDRPDFLYSDAGGYTRPLPSGGFVRYLATGQHEYTRNTQEQTTSITYDGQGRVVQMTIAYTGGGAAPYYTFSYNAQGKLSGVDANIPGQPDAVVIGHATNDGTVTSITDPDGLGVQFVYGTARPSIPNVRVDRRGTHLRFGYTVASRLNAAKVPLGVGDTIATIITPAEIRGISASAPLTQTYTSINGPRADVNDFTYLYLGRWGAPERIRDATGRETRIERTGAFPALPTAVTAPGGLRSSVLYDDRGRVERQVVHNPFGDGLNDTTRYEYDDRWNAPTRISRQRAADGTVLLQDLTMEYDNVGNRTWVQQGDNPAHRVHFTYHPAGQNGEGQVHTVSTPTAAGLAVDSVFYDGMHNVARTRSPVGFLTRYENDDAGRTTLVVSPTDSASARTIAGLNATGVQRHVRYDAMGRDTLSWTVGPAMGPSPMFALGASDAERVYVRTVYDSAGAVKHVARWVEPDSASLGVVTTTYTYDAAGRKITETEGARTQTFGYDHAGNPTTVTTGLGYIITTRYDVLGRAVRREVPAATYGAACYDETQSNPGGGTGGGPAGPGGQEPWDVVPGDGGTLSSTSNCIPFPYYPNAAERGLMIPAEWTYYRYDVAGNMVRAENGDAIVSRAYYPNGALRLDQTALRGYADPSYSSHVYALEYGYDRLGRVDSLKHPVNLTGGAPQYDGYTYNPVTGDLLTVTDRTGLQFSFARDQAGRLTHTYGPGNMVEAVTYDLDGRRTTRTESTAAAGQLHAETFRYDGRGKLLHADNGVSDYFQWYSGLGNLVATDWDNQWNGEASIEEFRVDPLGNPYWRRSGPASEQDITFPYATTYEAGSGRVKFVTRLQTGPAGAMFLADVTSRDYDASGNMIQGLQQIHGPIASTGVTGPARRIRSRSYYGADDRLRVFQESDREINSATGRRGVWEEYRYDPLGRRVMVRSNRRELCQGNQAVCTSHITRMVWAGDQLLWELRSDGGNPENATSYGDLYGAVSYTHAGGIDRPLAIHKGGKAAIIPHENWRGQFSLGTYADGRRSDCTNSTVYNCTPIRWPGHRTTAWHMDQKDPEINTWYGGLVDGMRDASGQMYMRNRYYDPATGQFTQPDPIGLAGGLNSYGFAAGDPVTYSDPYGLCPWLTLSGWVPCAQSYSYGGTVSLTRGRISSGEGHYGVRNPWVAAYSFLHYSSLRDWGEQQGVEQADANPSRNASNVANAARHQRWQCELTRKFGADEAAAAGNAHEEGSTFVNDSRADQGNNAIGRAVGRTSRHETGSCEQAVARNMDSGHFYQPTEEGVEYAGPAN